MNYKKSFLPFALAFGVLRVLAFPGAAEENLEEFETFKDCDDCPEMVVIPPGSFSMGGDYVSVYGDIELQISTPVHDVNIEYPFAVSKFKISVGDYKKFTQFEYYSEQDKSCGIFRDDGTIRPDETQRGWENPGFEQEDDHPVVCVSWASVQGYLRWLSGKTGQTYRLLSEAEWEYVARANQPQEVLDKLGTNLFANVGQKGSDLPGTGGNDIWEFTSPGNAFPPNAFGVYDMNGNTLEHVSDCVNGDYVGAPTDGSAWRTVKKEKTFWSQNGSTPDLICVDHVARSQAWSFSPRERWYYGRSWWYVQTSQSFVGFRIMRLLDED